MYKHLFLSDKADWTILPGQSSSVSIVWAGILAGLSIQNAVNKTVPDIYYIIDLYLMYYRICHRVLDTSICKQTVKKLCMKYEIYTKMA